MRASRIKLIPMVTPVLRFEPPGRILALDQTRLPYHESAIVLDSISAVCEAIVSLRVRGAPLLGLVGAAALALAAHHEGANDSQLRTSAERISSARPTAVDLRAQTERALHGALAEPEITRVEFLWQFAHALFAERIEMDRKMGAFGAEELASVDAVLTHCNSGELATGGIGTALGVIRTAFERGTLKRCFATETRPLLQGARLTTWELLRSGIPATLLPDTAAASLISSGSVGAVITGADRVARNGDAANKIGTLGLALAARHAGVPFYIAAPASTFDAAAQSGRDIPIEFRDAAEVGGFGEQRWSPPGHDVYNPAFDVTPNELITAHVTEAGILRPPFGTSIAAFLAGQ